MKPLHTLHTLLTTLVFSAAVSSFAIAQTADEHAGHHSAAEAPAAGTASPAPDAKSAPASPSPVAAGMKRLQDLMARIEAATDGDERENLMHEHMLALLEEVQLLRTQTHGMKMPMMGGKENDGSDSGEKDAAKPNVKDKKRGMMGGAMMGMHKAVEQRLDTIEQLLEQLIKHAHQRETTRH